MRWKKNKIYPKGCQKGTRGAKRVPSMAKMEPKGCQKGAEKYENGIKREPTKG